MRPAVVLAIETGIRRGDLLALTWENVADDVIRFTAHKTGERVEVPISNACREALEDLRAIGDGERVVPFGLGTLRQGFERARVHARVAVPFHALRHDFASRLASANVSPLLIQRALGHRTLSQTAAYARPDASALSVVKDALDGNLRTSRELANKKVRVFSGNFYRIASIGVRREARMAG